MNFTPGRVTVIVASYNHAKYLSERMESLIGQTWSDKEIIVIDDCSTDHSREVLRNYAHHPQVQLIEAESNTGWVSVSNRGAKIGTGEYLIFANCDDFCAPEMLEKLIKKLEQNPKCVASFCRSTMVDQDSVAYGDDFQGRERAFKNRCANDTVISGEEMSRFLLHSCVMPNLSAIVFRRKDFLSVGGLDPIYKVCSDWDLFFKLAELGDIAYVAAPLNSFRQHRTTIRKTTKERIVYSEYFELLTRNIRHMHLSPFERLKYIFRISTLWVQFLYSLSGIGLKNFFFHLRENWHYDKRIVLFLPVAGVVEVFAKFLRLFRKLQVR